MSSTQEAVFAAAQRFDPSGKFQLRSGLMMRVLDYLENEELPEGGILAFRGRAIGFLWATNKRVVYVGRTELSIFKSPAFIDHRYEKLTGVEVIVKGSALGIIAIKSGDARTEYSATPTTARLEEFAALIRKNVSTFAIADTHAPADDLATQLERLGRLRTQELLTEEEFRAAKAKVLRS